jgi:hypothetical protein
MSHIRKAMVKRWLVTCSCGWQHECSSRVGARPVSKLVGGNRGQDCLPQ